MTIISVTKKNSAVAFIGHLIRASAETLRSLTVGHELSLLPSIHWQCDPSYLDMGEVLCALAFKNVILELSSPKIMGLGVDPKHTQYFSDSINLSCLKSLTLESCPGSAPLLRQLAAAEITKGSAQLRLLELREFTVRNEAPDRALISALEAFLSRINPLMRLSVLLDNTDIMPAVTCFIAKHAQTLKSLVWEGRQRTGQGHTSITLGVMQDPTSEFSAIMENCTQLRELSVPWPWQDENVGND
jgi:hypothetical protein